MLFLECADEGSQNHFICMALFHFIFRAGILLNGLLTSWITEMLYNVHATVDGSLDSGVQSPPGS